MLALAMVISRAMERLAVKTCKECGVQFTPKVHWQEYHAVSCAQKRRDRRRRERVKIALRRMAAMEGANG